MNLDINLLPKSSKRLSGFDALLLIIIIIGLLSAVAFLCFYTPLNKKDTLQKQIEDREKELNKVTAEVQEYTDLVESVSIQTDKNNTINILKSSYILQSALLQDIEESLHSDVSIEDITLTQSSIIIKGKSNDYDSIAQSIVNLREKEYFVYESFSRVELDEVDGLYEFDLRISVAKPIKEESIKENPDDNEEEDENNDEAE